ncbi:NXPE family member 1-like [Mercenaria mercenaria]|uniref:NXPE family member 1-like n=1 Tax=Mercenaria mercenaria TaxID=6596 RepID=UPI00234F4AD2|nr:NXPE family member 1-like [Mercenaria mercenaria]
MLVNFKQKKTRFWLCMSFILYVLAMNVCSILKINEVQESVDHINHTYRHSKRSRMGSMADTESHQIKYSRLNVVVSETEALQHQPCQNTNRAADAKLSTLHVLDSPDKVYDIGEKIYVLATLFDSYGGQKSTGGDHLRARIFNSKLNASAPGTVYDHKNGSYTLIFEALWRGRSMISASVAYTREAITALYRMFYEVVSVKNILARYKFQNYTEDALCHPDVNHLLACTKYKDACNFTRLNSDMPWYCGKPQNPKLQCSDWKFVKSLPSKLPSFLSKCEKELLDYRSHQGFTSVINVTVKKPKQNQGREILQYYQPSIPCAKYKSSKLWYKKYTTGYFFQGRWKLTHCKGLNNANIQECMRNKILYLIGDSTTRQWYTYIREQYACIQFTEKWTDKKWKRPAGCRIESNNFTVKIGLHCQPFHVGLNWMDPKYTLISISKQLDLISSNEEAIFVFHIFAHIRSIHFEHFRNKMRIIRASIEKLLQRNNKVKIFIKMPHTFTLQSPGLYDFLGYVFTQILFVTFNGLYDKVIVLDNKDATNSVASATMHPDRFIVSAMVDQLFSYLCK